MGNNPVSMVDPDGDAIFTAMLVGAAISTAINGVTNTINKQPFFKNGGIAAISGAVSSGLFVAGNIGTQISLNAAGYKAVALNATGSAVSSHLPSANVSFGNFNLSLNPALVFGTQGFHVGANLGLSVNSPIGGLGVNGGIGYTNMSLGNNSIKGVTGSSGAGWYLGNAKNNFGLYTNNNYGGGVSQSVGGLRGTAGGVSLAYENDGAPMSNWGMGTNDAHDRWRANAFSIGYGGVDLQLNMFTGEPSGSTSDIESGYPHGVWNGGNADNFRLGALSIGFRGYRVGWNSEKIRNLFQNKFAHSEHRVLGRKLLHNQTYFRNLGGSGSIYSEFSTYQNPYSLWSFLKKC